MIISTDKLAHAHTLFDIQKAASECHVSSITWFGIGGFPLLSIEAMEDVRITLLIEGVFLHDLRMFKVPSTAGLTNSTWNMENIIKSSYMYIQFILIIYMNELIQK